MVNTSEAAAIRAAAATKVTRWLGKIFTSLRRQTRGAPSAGRADQVRTKPLRTKKNVTP